VLFLIKKCSKCGEVKGLEDFCGSKCKICVKRYKKEYYEKNKSKIKNYNSTHYEHNKEKVKKIAATYRKNNKDIIKERKAKYYYDNRIKEREKRLIYRKDNIKKIMFLEAKKRAIKKNIEFTITLDDIILNDICPLLNIEMGVYNNTASGNSYSLDRILLNKGYVKGNIQVISHKANTSKNNLSIDEYSLIVVNLEKIIKNGVTIATAENDINLHSNFVGAKSRSMRKNLPFDITYEYLKKVYPIDNKCPLLRIPLLRGKGCLVESSPTTDRIIPNKGYIEGNIIIISNKANLAKSNLSLAEMKLLLNNWKLINLKSNLEENGR